MTDVSQPPYSVTAFVVTLIDA